MTFASHEGSASGCRSVDYSLKRWQALTRFVDDGDLPIDDNWSALNNP